MQHDIAPKKEKHFVQCSGFHRNCSSRRGRYVIYLLVSSLACVRSPPLDGDTASCLISMWKRHDERWKWPQPKHNIINSVGEIILSTLWISILMSLHCLDLYSSLVHVNDSMFAMWANESKKSVSVAADVHVSCCCCPLLGWAWRQTVLMNHPLSGSSTVGKCSDSNSLAE